MRLLCHSDCHLRVYVCQDPLTFGGPTNGPSVSGAEGQGEDQKQRDSIGVHKHSILGRFWLNGFSWDPAGLLEGERGPELVFGVVGDVGVGGDDPPFHTDGAFVGPATTGP